ncbi:MULTISPECIES: aldehyde dehydrogenase family protein [unclassified Mesorhizobium]|uniref:aldehyde dehydrogenase family protein n=1 Tax=unclassified Mesorhizobium TaxID=325217 RepID=UPI001128E8D6|nr:MULTISPECIES: aldehyde dehydrogenase family protein [unclassified Mesorhizobium]TPL00756.1 aldehyde dehydrogenase family protein [Mesorhizobium sp. B2-4-16]TPL76983.1 aldehyde dehydrogenase family protein [Mesorhizobium sp. B2-4-3]
MSDVFLNLIDGTWTEGAATIENRNPSDTSDVIGHYASGSADDARHAASAAEAAADRWFRDGPQARADLLTRIADTIGSRATEIGTMLAREEGKVIGEAIAEVKRSAQTFRFYAGEALRIPGEALASVRPGVDVEILREPVGVVGLITPWNFPIALPAWKIAAALAYGNAVVFKPADLTPGTAHLLAQIIHEAGAPPGVFNLVMGSGRVVGSAIVEDPRIKAISFTGSVPTGHQIGRSAIAGMKKLQLEMGGKNPMVVMDDADLSLAVSVCLNGAFFSTGQRCTASSRLIVQSGIHDDFVKEMERKMRDLRVGHALHSSSQIGPVASASQLESNLAYVALAKDEGCEVVGGQRVDAATEGFFQAPALFVNASSKMRVSQEEIFGPCASIIRVGSLDEAIDVANDTDFGLASGICTTSLRSAREFKHRSRAGVVATNLPTAGLDYHVPFGGTKGSSFGSREQGRYAVEFYTTVKTSYSFAG